MGALAHLYRGEVYRSTLWRTRLDTTTNWSVVTLGVALSITFSSTSASPLPLILVGILILFFLVLEARRYRYFNVWRARARWLEKNFYAPILGDHQHMQDKDWGQLLANDYHEPKYHISYIRAIGRRLRRNYVWILLIQTLSYWGKVLVHPYGITSYAELWERTAVGPIPGQVMVFGGIIYTMSWIILTLITWYYDRAKYKHKTSNVTMG